MFYKKVGKSGISIAIIIAMLLSLLPINLNVALSATKAEVWTYAPENYDSTTATLKGYVVSDCAIKNAVFKYGTSSSNLNQKAYGYGLNGAKTGKFYADITNLQPNTTYYYIAKVENETGLWSEGYVANFTTKKAALSAPVITEPASDGTKIALYETGGFTVKWNAVNGATEYAVMIKNDEGDYEDGCQDNITTTSYTVSFIENDLKAGHTYTIEVYANDGSQISDPSCRTVDIIPREPEFLTPANNSSVDINNIDISWEGIYAGPSQSPSYLISFTDITAGQLVSGYSNISASSTYYSLPASAAKVNHKYRVDLTAVNNGVKGLTSSRQFTVTGSNDTTKPSVFSTNPVNGATCPISLGTLSIEYSEDILRGPNISSITVARTGMNSLGVKPSISGKVLTLTLENFGTPFTAGYTYTADIPAGAVKDLAGNECLSHRFSFTIDASGDGSAPYVVSTSPSDGQLNVSSSADIVITFNEPVVKKSGIDRPVTISNATYGDATLKTSQVLDSTGKILTITRTDGSKWGNELVYTCTLPFDNLIDAVGNVMAQDLIFSFTIAKTGGVPSATVPTVTTIGSSNITESGAELSGEISDNGGANISDYGIKWGTSPNLEDMRGKERGRGANYLGGSFSATISGLKANTTYYYTAYAMNSKGPGYGKPVKSFKTSGSGTSATVPTVTTIGSSNVTESSAVLSGEISDNGGANISDYGIKWGTSPNLEDMRGKERGRGANYLGGSFSATISGLKANTTYYYAAYAMNSKGPGYGNPVKSFKTSGSGTTATVPTVTTIGSSNVTESSAILSGEISDNGGANISDYGIKWGTSPNLEDMRGKERGRGANYLGGSFSATISGLKANTTYYYTAYAMNSKGPGYGEPVKSFKTSGSGTTATVPTVTTIGSSNVTESSAILSGEISDNGGANISDYGIKWGTSPNLEDMRGKERGRGANYLGGSFSATISGLKANTTYYYAAYAMNSKGPGYGKPVKSFKTGGSGTTATVPTVTTIGSSNITESSAELSGEISDNGGANISDYGIKWGTSPNLEDMGGKERGRGANYLGGSFSATISGLKANTTYYYAAYAMNSKGPGYGEPVKSFKTLDRLTFSINKTIYKVKPDGNTSVTLTPVIPAVDGTKNDYNYLFYIDEDRENNAKSGLSWDVSGTSEGSHKVTLVAINKLTKKELVSDTKTVVVKYAPLLQKGTSNKEYVKYLKKLLVTYKYLNSNEVNGNFDAYLVNTVKEFQAANGLQVDGKVGDNTWAKIMGGDVVDYSPMDPIFERPLVNEQCYKRLAIKYIQKFLYDQKYLSSIEQIDGVFGDITKEAIKILQTNFMWPVTGQIDSSMWENILKIQYELPAPDNFEVNYDMWSKMVTLSWDPVKGASKYHIYKYLDAEKNQTNGTKIICNSSEYQDTSIDYDSKYWYKVLAVDDNGLDGKESEMRGVFSYSSQIVNPPTYNPPTKGSEFIYIRNGLYTNEKGYPGDSESKIYFINKYTYNNFNIWKARSYLKMSINAAKENYIGLIMNCFTQIFLEATGGFTIYITSYERYHRIDIVNHDMPYFIHWFSDILADTSIMYEGNQYVKEECSRVEIYNNKDELVNSYQGQWVPIAQDGLPPWGYDF